MSIQKESNNLIGQRIKVLRMEMGINQQELALQLSKFMDRKQDYSLTTISAWELGRKTPPLATLYKLADFFGVSVDYLCNQTNDRQGKGSGYTVNDKSTEERDSIIDESKLLLRKEDYKKYDKMPVFVVFKNMDIKSQWGLLNLENQEVVFLNGRIALGEYDISLYVYPLPNEMYYNFWKIHAYSLQQLMQANMFWIELYSYDSEIKGKYNGWYTHNEDKTAIINCNNGYVLPYTGLNVSYVAYHSPNVNM